MTALARQWTHLDRRWPTALPDAAAAAGGLRAAVATLLDPADIDDDFRAEWRALGEAADPPNPFFLPWFLEAALTHLDEAQEVALCAVRDADGTLIGLAPVVFERGYAKLPIRHATIWQHEHFFNGTPLMAPGRGTDVFGALLDWIDTRPRGARFLRLSSLPLEAQIQAALTAACVRRGRGYLVQSRHERAVLTGGQDFEAVVAAAFSGKKRKELRRQAKRFGDLGRAEFAELPVGDSVDSFTALENAGWKREDPGGFPIARSEAETRFFRAAMTAGAAEGAVGCLALTLDGAPKAMLFGMRSGERLSAFKTSFDETLGAYSPGVRLLVEATRRMLDAPEIEMFDSCAKPDHPVVDRLWPQRLPIAEINVPTRFAADQALLNLAAALERTKHRILNPRGDDRPADD